MGITLREQTLFTIPKEDHINSIKDTGQTFPVPKNVFVPNWVRELIAKEKTNG